ncbi:MAG: hypothetical protein ACI8RZ_001418 [Myxococcota bacterium]|jgi:hypothetical protein
MDDPQPSTIIAIRAFIVRCKGWHPERNTSILCTAVQDLRETHMLELMLDPATTELLWTLSVTTLLMVAGGLTMWLMPWSDAEIMSVHRTVKAVAIAHLPTPLPATITATQPTRSRSPLASA